jgi:hypothetical protein
MSLKNAHAGSTFQLSRGRFSITPHSCHKIYPYSEIREGSKVVAEADVEENRAATVKVKAKPGN